MVLARAWIDPAVLFRELLKPPFPERQFTPDNARSLDQYDRIHDPEGRASTPVLRVPEYTGIREPAI